MAIPISNVPRRIVFVASGVGPYAFTFEILAETDISVYRDDTLLELTTDYTVTINANGTGSVTLVATPTGATQIAIVGDRSIARSTDFTTGGDFFANTLNDELDQQTIFAQQNAEGLARALQAPQTDPLSINMTLPRAAERANKYLAFDADGDPAPGPNSADVDIVAGIASDIVTVSGISSQVTTVAGNDANVTTVAGISGNVTTVAGISGNVTTVAGNTSNINSVAGNSSNINTVAGSIANVNATGTSIASVNTVAGELGVGQDVTVVAANLSGTDTIGTVAGSIANVNAVGTNISNVNAVNSNATNINTVAGQITPTNNVSSVAAVAASVATVAGISSSVTTVATNSANVTTVAGSISGVNAVAGSIGSVNTVSANTTNINAVAGNSTNINTVATNASSVNAVAGNATNINTVAGNNTNITTVAGVSANVTTVAGIAANVTTVATNNANVTTVATNISDVQDVADALAGSPSGASLVSYDGTTSGLVATDVQDAIDEVVAEKTELTLSDARLREAFRKEKNTTIAPSLLLDFSGDKILDPRITFTRTTEARYYDGKTVAKAEENLFQRSQEFDQSPWTTNGTVTVTANSVAAPDGTTTADTIDNTASAAGFRYQEVSLVIGQVYQWSIFVKNNTATSNVFQVRTNSTAAFIVLNWTGATLDSLTQTAGTATFSSVGNDWYRVVITYTAAEASTRHRIYGGNASTTGSAIYVWGAQLEQRSSVTAYTPTTTQPITNYIPVLQTAASGQARFDHNPVTGESLGLLIEEQRTNLLTYSDDFSNAAWAKTNLLTTDTTNVVLAPDGTISAEILKPNTTNGLHYFDQQLTLSAVSYSISVYAKAAGYDYLAIGERNGSARAYFNLSNGTVGNTNGSPTTSITPVGNGWYRCSVAFTSAGGVGKGAYFLVDNTNGSLTNWSGNGYSGVYIWGAQLETGAFPTSYIPTVASQVTRNADAASMTGTNFSSWYRADEGTLYGEALISNTSGNKTLALLTSNTTNGEAQRIQIRTETSTGVGGFVCSESSVVQAALTNGTYSSTGMKIAGTYKVNDFALSCNGATVSTDTSGLVPKPTELRIGYKGSSSNEPLNGTLRKLAYYPARLANAQLQSLTTV